MCTAPRETKSGSAQVTVLQMLTVEEQPGDHVLNILLQGLVDSTLCFFFLIQEPFCPPSYWA